jgi:hypothetical protein
MKVLRGGSGGDSSNVGVGGDLHDWSVGWIARMNKSSSSLHRFLKSISISKRFVNREHTLHLHFPPSIYPFTHSLTSFILFFFFFYFFLIVSVARLETSLPHPSAYHFTPTRIYNNRMPITYKIRGNR